MRYNPDENCGHCIYHRKEDGEWVCNNPDSECFGCYTEFEETCIEFEERRAKTKFSVEIVKNSKKS